MQVEWKKLAGEKKSTKEGFLKIKPVF